MGITLRRILLMLALQLKDILQEVCFGNDASIETTLGETNQQMVSLLHKIRQHFEEILLPIHRE